MAKKTQHFNPRQSMNGDSYEIFHYLDMASRHLEAHYHEFYELYFFVAGDMDYWIEGSLYHLQPGDLLLIDPMALHKPVPRSDEDRYERIVLWIHKNYLASIQNGELEACFQTGQRLLRPAAADSRQISQLLQRLTEEYYSADPCSQSYAFGLLLQLMATVNRAVGEHIPGEEENYSSPTIITEVLSYINTHYRQALTLEHLANHFFINKYYLSHQFRKTVGTGVHRYITLKRLHYAYDALLEGIPAGEAAVQSGFSDYTAFYKAFRSQYGISPTDCIRHSKP